MALDTGFDAAKFLPKEVTKFSKKKTLPKTIEKTQLLETAEKYNTVVAYATPEGLRASLPEKFKVRSADLMKKDDTPNLEETKGTQNVVSTESDPAVIVIYSASFCSLMLAKDNRGNAVGLHQPITYFEGRLNTIKDAIKQMRVFFDSVMDTVKDRKGFLIVSGANPFSLDDDNQAHLVNLVQKQIRKTNLDLVKLFIKPNESEYLRHKRTAGFNKLRDIKDWLVEKSPFNKKAIKKNIRTIDGLIYVPRQIDKDGKDRVFVMDRSTDNVGIKEALFGKVAKTIVR